MKTALTHAWLQLKTRTPRLFLTAGVLLAVISPARALTINPVFDSSISNLATTNLIISSFNTAAKYFQDTYSDAVTVNLNVYFGNQGPFSGGSPIGGAASFGNDLTTYTYAQTVAFLTAD